MATLIVDIVIAPATAPLSTELSQVFLGWIDDYTKDPDVRERLHRVHTARAVLHPMCATIEFLMVYDRERSLAAVYMVGDVPSTHQYGNCTLKIRTESELLQEFWQGAAHFDTFVTFDGRATAVPFLVHRSRVHGVAVTRCLYEGRYPSQQHTCRHIDLLDELTLYGALRRPRQLEPWLTSFGISTSKMSTSATDDTAVPLGVTEAYARITALAQLHRHIFPDIVR